MEKSEYYDGFMVKRPSWNKALRQYRSDLYVLLADILFLVAMWLFVTYASHAPERGELLFLTVPWWVMLLVTSLAAGLWQSFGLSPGMKLMGRRLVDRRTDDFVTEALRRIARSIIVLLTPLLIFPVLVTARYTSLHNQLLGFDTVSAAEIVEPKRPWYRRSWSVGVLLLAAAALIVSVIITRVDVAKLFTDFDNTAGIRRQIANPNWEILAEGGQLLLVTLFMALMATLFGIVVAVPLSFIAARNLTEGVAGRSIYTVIRGVLSILRSIQPFIWVIIFVVWVKPSNAPMAGVLALFIHSVADLTKLYAERLESIDPGPMEAIRATGANRLQVILYGIIPQIINPYMSFTIYRWDINVRMSTLVGMVGGGGIGQRLLQEMRVNDYSDAIVLMLLIMAAVWAMDTLSARLRERFETGSGGSRLTGYARRLRTKIAGRSLSDGWRGLW